MPNGDRVVLGPNLEPGEIGRNRRLEVDYSSFRELENEERRERLADRAELEERSLVDRAPPSEVGPSRALKGEKAVSVRHRDGNPRQAAALEQGSEPGFDSFRGSCHRWILGSHGRSGLSSSP
jgi:hypothetical protein